MIAVVIVNWNGRAVTLDCLRSLRQVTNPPLSLIVVDNASMDGSPEAIRAEFPGVDLLAMPRNLRFAGGSNAGIRRALERGADMIMLLNKLSDFLLQSGFSNPYFDEYRNSDREPGSRIIVSANKPALISGGGPLTNTVTVNRRGKYLALSYNLVGADGTSYQIWSQDRSQPPDFAVYQGDKKIGSGKFEFG